jgi:hypothetical protein
MCCSHRSSAYTLSSLLHASTGVYYRVESCDRGCKVIGREFSGLEDLINCEVPGLIAPLAQAVRGYYADYVWPHGLWSSSDGFVLPWTPQIDYKGRRVLATCILPIDGLMKKLGPNATDVDSNTVQMEALASLLGDAGKRLNVKPHSVNGHLVPLSLSVQAYVGFDSRSCTVYPVPHALPHPPFTCPVLYP